MVSTKEEEKEARVGRGGDKEELSPPSSEPETSEKFIKTLSIYFCTIQAAFVLFRGGCKLVFSAPDKQARAAESV